MIPIEFHKDEYLLAETENNALYKASSGYLITKGKIPTSTNESCVIYHCSTKEEVKESDPELYEKAFNNDLKFLGSWKGTEIEELLYEYKNQNDRYLIIRNGRNSRQDASMNTKRCIQNYHHELYVSVFGEDPDYLIRKTKKDFRDNALSYFRILENICVNIPYKGNYNLQKEIGDKIAGYDKYLTKYMDYKIEDIRIYSEEFFKSLREIIFRHITDLQSNFLENKGD